MTYTATAVDIELMLADGMITEDEIEQFEIVTPEEMRSMLAAANTALIARRLYDRFWSGYEAGRVDAAVALPAKRKSLRERLAGWLRDEG